METIQLQLDRQTIEQARQIVARHQADLEQIFQEIVELPESRLLELLEFIKFLQFKEQTKPLEAKSMTQQEILAELDHIRERVQQNYGVYNGDALAEARAEREEQITHTLGLDQ